MQFAFEIGPGKQFKRRSRYPREMRSAKTSEDTGDLEQTFIYCTLHGCGNLLSLEHATGILPINHGNNTARRLNAMHYACGEGAEAAICKRKGFSSSGGFVSFGNYCDSHMAVAEIYEAAHYD